MTKRSRWVSTGLLVVAAGLVLSGQPMSPASADGSATASIFTASARADGVRYLWTVPGAPLFSNIADSGGPRSQAVLSSVAGIRASAALPDPGDNATSGPGTLFGALGANGVPLGVSPPAYPFAAYAATPGTAEQKVGDGPYAVEARTSDSSAQGTARSGYVQEKTAAFVASLADSKVERTADRIAAQSAALMEGLTIGPVTIGRLTSNASAVLVDKTVERKSSLEMAGVKIGETVLGPGPMADQLATMNKAIAPSGLALALVPENQTASGVASPSLELVLPFPAPNGNGFMKFVFGGTSASVEASQFDESLPIDEPPVASTSDTSSTAAGPIFGDFSSATTAPDVASAAASMPTGADAAFSFGSGSTAGTFPEAAGPAATEATADGSTEPDSASGGAATNTGPREAALAFAQRRAAARFDVGSSYLLVLGLGALGLGITLALGRRRQWTS